MNSIAELWIGKTPVGRQHPPFIVAELSGNHQGSLDLAKEVMLAAKRAGVHAIKLQTYRPDTITLNSTHPAFQIEDPKSLWAGRTLFELYEEAHLPWEWHEAIFAYGRSLGLPVFSTPFDETAVDFLEQFNPPCYKIASPEMIDLPLIDKVARTKKPLLISTGGATLSEIEEAVQTALKAGCTSLLLMKCTTAYPSLPEDLHLRTIPHLAEAFGVPIGLSDHSLGIGAALASIALGACLIEKHFTLSRERGGVDSAFSLEPEEMELLVKESLTVWKSLGEIRYGMLPSEAVTYSHRPSLYFVEDIPKGAVITAAQIRSVRPNQGLPPKEIEKIIGLSLMREAKKGTPVTWDFFKGDL